MQKADPDNSVIPNPSMIGMLKNTLKSSANSLGIGAEAHKIVFNLFPNMALIFLKINLS